MNDQEKQAGEIMGDVFFKDQYKKYDPCNNKVTSYCIIQPYLVEEPVHTSKILNKGGVLRV